MSHEPSPRHHATYLSLVVAAVALTITIGFHFLVSESPYGTAVAAFVLLLMIGLQIVAVLTGRQGNMWAYIFLLPAICAALAELLYASSVVHLLAVPLILISLVLFSYWLTAPTIPFHQVISFWPKQVVTETIIPLPSPDGFLEGFSVLRHGNRIITGLAIALPFVLIIAVLFASADPLFGKYIQQLMFWRGTPTDVAFFRLIRDVIVGIYFVRAGWAMLSRSLEQRQSTFFIWRPDIDHVILSTFLSALNLLFLAFIGFQLVYFFGGTSIVQNQGLT